MKITGRVTRDLAEEIYDEAGRTRAHFGPSDWPPFHVAERENSMGFFCAMIAASRLISGGGEDIRD